MGDRSDKYFLSQRISLLSVEGIVYTEGVAEHGCPLNTIMVSLKM
jgi:hypothetical protein